LHFACLWKRSKAVSILLSENADHTIPFSHYEWYIGLDLGRRSKGGEFNDLTAKQIAAKKRVYTDCRSFS